MTEPSRRPWRPRVLLALVALLLAAIVVVALALLSARNRPLEVAPTPTPSATPTSVVDADGTGDADGAGGRPDVADRALGDLLVPAAGPFVSADLRAVEPSPEQGRLAVYEGTFTNGRDVVALRAVELASAQDAASAAIASAPDGFSADDLRDTGDVGDPVVGAYTTYERGTLGAIRWTNGPRLLELTGPWQQVRALYLAYPL